MVMSRLSGEGFGQMFRQLDVPGEDRGNFTSTTAGKPSRQPDKAADTTTKNAFQRTFHLPPLFPGESASVKHGGR